MSSRSRSGQSSTTSPSKGVSSDRPIVTALDYPLTDISLKQFDGYWISTVVFKDGGLVWSNKRVNGLSKSGAWVVARPDEEEKDADAAYLESMGLPTTFQSTKRQGTQKDMFARLFQHVDAAPPAWREGHDPVRKLSYYYNESQGISQWEMPRTAYLGLDGAMHGGAAAAGTGETELGAPPPARAKDLSARSAGCHLTEADCVEHGLLPHLAPHGNGSHVRLASEEEEGTVSSGGHGPAPDASGAPFSDAQSARADSPSMKRAKEQGKYWIQRYSLFSRFDAGIRLDAESWYSVTPELVARWHAARVAEPFARLGAVCVALDSFAGAGGNAIALARACSHALSIELEGPRAADAARNARVYGVQEALSILQGDCFVLSPALAYDVAFFCPPWGGPQYSRAERYSLDDMGGGLFGLGRLLDLAFDGCRARGAVLFVPRNSDLRQAVAAAKIRGLRLQMERTVLNGVCKGLTLYYGCVAWEFEGGEGRGLDPRRATEAAEPALGDAVLEAVEAHDALARRCMAELQASVQEFYEGRRGTSSRAAEEGA